MSSRKKILVICQNYPSPQNRFSQPFIHTRVSEYVKHFEVVVVSFASKDNYLLDQVAVYSEKGFRQEFRSITFDVLVSHAPNIRNHQRFILWNFFQFRKIIFVFHGYEVIDIHKRVYSQPTYLDFPHPYSRISKFYHKIKLPFTCIFLRMVKTLKPCHFIFVSNQLFKEAREDLKCNIFSRETNTSIVNNPINNIFSESTHSSTSEFDFICIRPFDDPKYGVDIFIKLAEKNPNFSFHLFGKGTLPKIENLSKNLNISHKYLKPEEMTEILKKYRAAILPTRWDSQGVLACEIAVLGMPLITSKLPVCEEFLSTMKNVILFENESIENVDLNKLELRSEKRVSNPYDHKYTTHEEIKVVENFMKEA